MVEAGRLRQPGLRQPGSPSHLGQDGPPADIGSGGHEGEAIGSTLHAHEEPEVIQRLMELRRQWIMVVLEQT